MTEAAFPTSAPESTSLGRRLLPDERLARRAAQGDTLAFEAIYRRYHQRLYRFCLAMTGHPHDAQEALQNTMVKVLRALPGEEREIKLKPWLFRIARNEAIEVQRKRRNSEQLDAERLTEGPVTETAEVRERLRTLLGDLEQLPERQRAVLLMRELSGLEFAEIGAAYDTSEGAVRQALYEARLNLRALEEGRERACADVRRELSDADGRVIRRLKTRAHLRSCPGCRAFGDEIAARRQSLGAIAPLPLAISADLLRDVLGQFGGPGAGAAGGGAGLAGVLGAGAGQTLATSAAVKSAAAVAMAVLAVTAADRSGIVDLPGPLGGGSAASGVGASSAGDLGPRGGADRPTAPPAGGDRQAGARAGGQATAAGHANGGENSSAADKASNAHQNTSASAHGEPQQVEASPSRESHDSPGADRGGRPEQMPDAAANGQQAAPAQKPDAPPAAQGQAGAPGKPEMPPQSEGAPSQGTPGGPPPSPPKPAPPPPPPAPATPPATGAPPQTPGPPSAHGSTIRPEEPGSPSR